MMGECGKGGILNQEKCKWQFAYIFLNAPFFNSSDLWLPVGFPQTIQLVQDVFSSLLSSPDVFIQW